MYFSKLFKRSTVFILFCSLIFAFYLALVGENSFNEEKNEPIASGSTSEFGPSPSENLAYSLATQAFIYGYPLLTLERTKQLRAPTQSKESLLLNKYSFSEELSTPEDKSAMAMNSDTLYFDAWLNVSKEPVLLNVPDTNDRYYSIQLVDAWGNTIDYIGRRATGTKEGQFVIVPPNWKGTLPKGAKKIESPTENLWAIGRIFANNEKDLKAAVDLEKKFTITTIDGKDATIKEQRNQLLTSKSVDSLSSKDFLRLMNENIRKNTPRKEEEILLDQYKEIGINPNANDPLKDITQDTLKGVDKAIKDTVELIKYKAKQRSSNKNWKFSYDAGVYGNNYLSRAVVTHVGTVAHIPEEAVYATTLVDGDNTQLNGENRYVLHFTKEQLPDVKAFWSLSMYGEDYFLVKNPINRYKIGDFTEGLQYNKDGSLDIYIQHESPPGKESNWLPAHEGNFRLYMRFYQPGDSVLQGAYKMPSVQKIN